MLRLLASRDHQNSNSGSQSDSAWVPSQIGVSWEIPGLGIRTPGVKYLFGSLLAVSPGYSLSPPGLWDFPIIPELQVSFTITYKTATVPRLGFIPLSTSWGCWISIWARRFWWDKCFRMDLLGHHCFPDIFTYLIALKTKWDTGLFAQRQRRFSKWPLHSRT